MRSRIAWTSAAVACVLVMVDVVVSAQAVSLLSETAIAVHGFPFIHAAVLGSALMGALIISRYERHPVGWLLALVGAAGSVSLLAEAYAYWVQEAGGPGPAALAGVSAWLSALLGGRLEVAAVALMFLLAPDGRLLSPRWRYAAWLVVGGILLCTVTVLSIDPTTYRLLSTGREVGPGRTALMSIGFLAVVAGLVAAAVSMLMRVRRSSGVQRRQLRPLLLAVALPAFGIVWLVTFQDLRGGRQTWVASLPLFMGFFLLPVLFAVAVLRHRLYELDVIINRTAVVLAATIFAAVGYTTVVLAVSSLVDQQTGGLGVSLLATALVAVAFQPVRRRVVLAANRLAYGVRAQPYEELAGFSSRLVETPSVERLLPAVAAAAGEALAARSATATLGTRSSSWGDAAAEADRYRVEVGDEGEIEVALPRGRGLRASDERLLRALADQAGVAFGNVALETRLGEHVEALRRTTTELARSRARVVEADDAVRRDLESAISRDVLPHLLAVSDGLDRGGDVEPLIDEVNVGLEALREITRGVFPMQLARSGIRVALRSFPLDIGAEVADRRFPARVEAAVYYACTQTGASSAALNRSDGDLVLTLAQVARLPQAVVDRVEAAGGSVTASSDRLSVVLPDLQQPVGVEGGLGDVRRGAGA